MFDVNITNRTNNKCRFKIDYFIICILSTSLVSSFVSCNIKSSQFRVISVVKINKNE